MSKNVLDSVLVSKFNSYTSSTEVSVSVFDELQKIKSGYYSTDVLNARQFYSTDKILYNRYKKKLPAVTFSGVFDLKRTLENLSSYSGYIILDVDGLVEESVLNQVKSNAISEEFVVAAWISPSGQGLKILVKVGLPQTYHKVSFSALVNYFNAKHKIIIDISGSDIPRLCFSSFDKDLLLKSQFSEFGETLVTEYYDHQEQIKKEKIVKPKIELEVIARREAFLLNSPINRNARADRDNIKKIIRYLSFKKLSITTTYDEWYRVAIAIANSFTYDVGRRYYLELCRLDNESHDEEGSDAMLSYCYIHRRLNVINFGTLVYMAKQKGFKLNFRSHESSSNDNLN